MLGYFRNLLGILVRVEFLVLITFHDELFLE
jgi:hypothetical protein